MTTLSLVLATLVLSSPFSPYTLYSHDSISGHGLPCLARLNNEKILLTWSKNNADSSDFSVHYSLSSDGGCSWTPPKPLLDAPGIVDADPSIVVVENRVIVTCTRTSFSQGIRASETIAVRSEDNAQTWSEPYSIPMNHKYTCGKCHRALRLSSGTVLMGYSWDTRCEKDEALSTEGQMDLRAGVMRSTDGGLTWTNGGDTTAIYEKKAEHAVAGTDEPALVQLSSGTVYMLMRTGDTHLYEAFSDDDGLTWRDIRPSPLRSTNAPAALTSFEYSGRKGVLCIWDNSPTRYPLCASVSFDDCKTWSSPRDLAAPYRPGNQASYPSVDVTPDGFFLAAWQQDVPGGRDLRIARFSPEWILDPVPQKTVVLFGESTTAPRGPLLNFASHIQSAFPETSIVNMGIGGENTDSARARFARDVLSFSPSFVVIYYGLNDAAIDVWKGATEPRISLDKFTDNYRYFISTARENNITPILLTPNPCSWSQQQLSLYGKPPYDPSHPEGFNKLLLPYVERLRSLASELNLSLVDVFAIIQTAASTSGYAHYMLDGVHPNERAHSLIADSLIPLLKPTLKP